jgi:isopentenyl diphosphate isomerase/L-lactate dehydrogenase-like FMN-dependent dehydrogenase
VQAASAAEAASLAFCSSSASICGIEEVAAGLLMVPWFQLYMIRDRDCMRSLLDRVRRASLKILVFGSTCPPRVRAIAGPAWGCTIWASAACSVRVGKL